MHTFCAATHLKHKKIFRRCWVKELHRQQSLLCTVLASFNSSQHHQQIPSLLMTQHRSNLTRKK